ncbi:hypothetical protein CHUAL_006892 [Chamberlinius hualienensis]
MAGLGFSTLILLGLYYLSVVQCQQCSISPQNQAQVQTLANGNLEFALNLFKGLKDDNLFLSPFSISVALTMVLAGAKGSTSSQMKSTLNLGAFSNDAQINQAYQAVLNSICSNNNYTLSTANKIFAQENFPIFQSYLDILKNYYKSSAENVNFVTNGDGVAEQINSWIEQQTNNLIKDVIPPGTLSPDTVLVLVNAIYFKGIWQKEFQDSNSKLEDFTLSNGKTVSTSIMNNKDHFLYGEDNQLNAKVIGLPYAGNRLSMYVILPNQVDGLPTLKNQLDSTSFRRLLSSLSLEIVQVKLPSFTLSFKKTLNDLLQKLGMVDLFNPFTANLTGISNPENGRLSVSDVIHQSYVKVDEKGTTAAAVTVVAVIKTLSVEASPIIYEFYATHPFIFVIYDKDTDLILFIGNLDNPKAKSTT